MAPVTILTTILQWIADSIFALIPQREPSADRIRTAKLIAHRGNTGLPGLQENTLAAFEAAITSGAWGIEFDLHWTSDGVPIIIHDRNLQRVFGVSLDVEVSRHSDVVAAAPEVPTLAAALEAFKGRTHFMVEIKQRAEGFEQSHIDSLKFHLKDLQPGWDYHLIALDLDTLKSFDFVPKEARIGVADVSISAMSDAVFAEGWGGIAGPYLLIDHAMKDRHQRCGQKVGTGFVVSKNCLYRELNRGVDWIFTNHTDRLGRILKKRA